MSGLYNMLFGYNRAAPLVLAALGLTHTDVPRFRDAWYAHGELVIYTRTGGANRGHYENPAEGPGNGALRALPGFLRDEDDGYDSTYASFYFAIPPTFEDAFVAVKEALGDAPAPGDRWKSTVAAMRSDDDTEEKRNAMDVGKQLLGPLIDRMKGDP